MESHPPSTWTESGQTPDLPESSSSRVRTDASGARVASEDCLRSHQFSLTLAARFLGALLTDFFAGASFFGAGASTAAFASGSDGPRSRHKT
jgi:hypothetical protein